MTGATGANAEHSDDDVAVNRVPPVGPCAARVGQEPVVIVITMTALVVFFSAFTLDQPYHLDTTAYFEGLRDWRGGRITCPYGSRCMVSYYLLPFAVFGGHAVKVGFIAAAALFFWFSQRFLSRALSPPTAYVSSLMVLAIPAGLITVTHLKEDFVGLMFVAAALWLAMCPTASARLSSAIAFSCGLLAKETFLLFTPFYLSILSYSVFIAGGTALDRTLRDWRKWLLLAAAVAVSAGLTFLLNPDYVAGMRSLTSSPYLGQFRGPFSDLLPAGLALFERGVGLTSLFWFQLAGVIVLFVEKEWRPRILLGIFAVNAVLLAVFSTNNTVMTYRNFVIVAFLTFPLAAYTAERLVGRKWLYFAAGVAVAALVARSYPYVAFHGRYNSQELFFAGLKDRIGEDAILLTMDYAGLAKHYLGSRTKQRVPDPDEAQAEAFVASIRNDPAYSYYLLPDALAYDASNTIRSKLQAAFTIEPVYDGWFEDYHAMDYGYGPGELLAKLAQGTGCRGTGYDVEEPEIVGSMTLDRYRFHLTCGSSTRTATYLGYKGTVLVSLVNAQVYRLGTRQH